MVTATPRRVRVVRVESSFITALAHDEATRELRVVIRGRGYGYANVSRQKFGRMLAADSIGAFYCKLVKGKPEMHPRTAR